MSEARAAQARINGKLGGRPTLALTELRKQAREDAHRLLADEQVRSINFLVQVRDDEDVDIRERVKCACEILDRGESPKKSASYHGVGEVAELDALFGSPKMVIVGKFGSDRPDSDRLGTDLETERVG